MKSAAGFIKSLDKDMQERRRSRRVPANDPVEVTVGRTRYPTTLIDISTGGARLKAVPGVQRGEKVRIAMPDRRNLEATVVWARDGAFGVEFKRAAA